MAQVINTNNLLLITQNNINKDQFTPSSPVERPSSSLRINNAKDDATGQTIASCFTSNIRGLTQAMHNANDGISVVQTIKDALSETNNNLQRTHGLAVQVSTGTNSDSDLDSIQGEIKSRLGETDRVPGQTQFNGVNVPTKDGSIEIQVSANDGQTIAIGLKEVNPDTLGLNGFNVNGSGTIANKAATISDLIAARTDAVTNTITTTDNASTASKAPDRSEDGDTVTIRAGAAQIAMVCVYNASVGNFSFSNTSNNTSTKADDVAASLLSPVGQTASGVHKTASSEVNFDVDANGKIIVRGQEAYLISDGNLTTNDAGGATATALDGLFKKVSDGQSVGFSKTVSIMMGGATYNLKAGADAGAATANAGVSLTNIASRETALNKVATAEQGIAAIANDDTSATIIYRSGVQAYQAISAADDGTASAEYVDDTDISNITATCIDANGGMTTISLHTMKYSIDTNNGKAIVDSGTGTGKCASKVGAEVYASVNGTLTTDATNESTVAEDPLKVLDEAINSIDRFRSSLGAIQNYLDSAITNLNNIIANLSEMQSRIRDADYAAGVPNMSKAQTIQQAGNSVSARANQVLQQVLSLLQG